MIPPAIALGTALEVGAGVLAGVLLVLVAFGVVGAVSRRRQTRTRQAALLEWVKQRDGVLREGDARGLASYYGYFALLGAEAQPTFERVAQLTVRERGITIAELRHSDSSGRRIQRSIVLVDLPATYGFSHVAVRPAGIAQDGAAAAGLPAPPAALTPLALGDDPELEARYGVATNNPALARALLGSPARGLLLAVPPVVVEVTQRTLLVGVAAPVLPSVAETEQLMAFALDLATSLPKL